MGGRSIGARGPALGALCAGLVGLAAAGGGAGCGGGGSASGGGGAGGSAGGAGGSACPNDLPEMCPAPEPSYSKDIEAIFEARCATCHAPGGAAAEKPLDSYTSIYGSRTSVLTRVYGCKMPPPGATPLTGEERAALLAWLICGAKDN